MKMKGVSLAIETIIFIVLAVVVLTVLLFFFTSQAGPAQNRFEQETRRNNLCVEYLNVDGQCNDQTKWPQISRLNDLTKVCAELKVKGCAEGSNSLPCIQRCCIACPTKPPS